MQGRPTFLGQFFQARLVRSLAWEVGIVQPPPVVRQPHEPICRRWRSNAVEVPFGHWPGLRLEGSGIREPGTLE